MRRYQMRVVVLTLVLLMVTMTGGASQTQEPGGGAQLSPRSSSDPLAEGEQNASPPDQPDRVDAVDAEVSQAQGPDVGAQPSPRSSSDPLMEGQQSATPPDQPARVDAVDAEPAATYNASLRISGAAVKPRESNVEWTGVGGAGGCIYASSGSTNAVFNTPLYLPQKATIKYFRMYYNDQNASKNCSAWFTVYDLYGVVVEEWGISSSGTGKTYVTTSEFTHEIDYDLYSYVVNWRPYELGSDMQVCGFRIYYHTPPGLTYLPVVTSNP